MNCTVTIELAEAVTDMSREEILKQVVHLSRALSRARITPDGMRLQFEVPAEEAESTRGHAERLCALIQRCLRQVERKVVYRTRGMAQPVFRGGAGPVRGIHAVGLGQVMLEGMPLRLFRYFDWALGRWEQSWAPQELLTPALIPASVLAKCDYFRSFPSTVTFACHLQPEAGVIDTFRARHRDQPTVDGEALGDMAPPEACLSPAVCYHVYQRHQDTELQRAGTAHSVRGRCFRYEGTNLAGMRRLWDFTMRELVFMGPQERVLQRRDECVESAGALFEALGLAVEIRTASDPFYMAPDALSKTYFQLSAETKYEVSALLPEGERLAVGSLNYHTDFFGRAFHITVEGEGPSHSACIGFGLERLVHAFLVQQGSEPAAWPDEVRRYVADGGREGAVS